MESSNSQNTQQRYTLYTNYHTFRLGHLDYDEIDKTVQQEISKKEYDYNTIQNIRFNKVLESIVQKKKTGSFSILHNLPNITSYLDSHKNDDNLTVIKNIQKKQLSQNINNANNVLQNNTTNLLSNNIIQNDNTNIAQNNTLININSQRNNPSILSNNNMIQTNNNQKHSNNLYGNINPQFMQNVQLRYCHIPMIYYRNINNNIVINNFMTNYNRNLNMHKIINLSNNTYTPNNKTKAN